MTSVIVIQKPHLCTFISEYTTQSSLQVVEQRYIIREMTPDDNPHDTCFFRGIPDMQVITGRRDSNQNSPAYGNNSCRSTVPGEVAVRGCKNVR